MERLETRNRAHHARTKTSDPKDSKREKALDEFDQIDDPEEFDVEGIQEAMDKETAKALHWIFSDMRITSGFSRAGARRDLATCGRFCSGTAFSDMSMATLG